MYDQICWEKTLLIITYDEHGGFYDHVLPPNDAIALAPDVTRLGPRVPALVMSPYIPAKTVSKEIYDHTTILATIVRRFIHPDFYSWLDLGPRVLKSKDLSPLLTLNKPRRPTFEFETVNVPPYTRTAFSKKYKMGLPPLKSNGFHETLLGYRLLMGFPPR